MDKKVEELLGELKSTKGCRFNTAKRLEGRDRRMALLIALASALLIALTSLAFIYHLNGVASSDLSAITLAMSVLILAVSLLQYSNNDAVNSEQHHRCGLELNELRRELRSMMDIVTPEYLTECGKRYDSILQKYSINHDDIDYDKYQIEHPDEYKLAWLERIGIYRRLLIANHWPNVLMWGIVAFAIWFFAWHVLPARVA